MYICNFRDHNINIIIFFFRIQTAVNVIFLKQLTHWILYATILDTYGEFFIQSAECNSNSTLESEKGTSGGSGKYAPTSYSVCYVYMRIFYFHMSNVLYLKCRRYLAIMQIFGVSKFVMNFCPDICHLYGLKKYFLLGKLYLYSKSIRRNKRNMFKLGIKQKTITYIERSHSGMKKNTYILLKFKTFLTMMNWLCLIMSVSLMR